MRAILRKLDRHYPLSQEEHLRLLDYARDLQVQKPYSYQVFYDRYAELLFQNYDTYLPGFQPNLDDLINLFIQNPELLAAASSRPLTWQLFPEPYHRLLQQWNEPSDDYAVLDVIIRLLQAQPNLAKQLPEPRREPVIMKFEDNNPYKESGLKVHFDRLARYQFVSRLQSYRYLTRNKASHDRIEIITGDRLGGIFTNKDKSIYYYIFLTEDNLDKAQEAARLLNLAFYL